MFEGIKKLFKTEQHIEPSLNIDGMDIMSVLDIVKDNPAFSSMDVVVRYLYTKDKERETTNQIGFIKETLDKPKKVC